MVLNPGLATAKQTLEADAPLFPKYSHLYEACVTRKVVDSQLAKRITIYITDIDNNEFAYYFTSIIA